MLGIAGDNPLLLILCIMIDIIDRHADDLPIGRALVQETPDNFANALQGRECHPYRAVADVRSR